MSTNPPLARVETVEAPGTAGPSQDRVFTCRNAVVVLDGASSPEPGGRDGAWMADTLGRTLAALLDDLPEIDLSDALYQALTTVRARHGLIEGKSPSTTVSIVRWSNAHVDALVLGDSPVVVELRSGEIVTLMDDRLARLADRAQYEPLPRNNPAANDRWRALVQYERSKRNQPDGYWIAEANPEAARYALTGRWGRPDVSHALALTDGIADCVTVFQALPDWRTVLEVACDNLPQLVVIAERAEDADPNGHRWPRTKHRDDKAAALITLT
jgi:hypothetical protein